MRVEEATEADVGALSQILGEVEAYYGGEDAVPGNPEQIQDALFGPASAATVLIARDDDGEALGFASYSKLFPAAGADMSLFLKELFVRERARRQGVGGQLMDAVEAAAAAVGSRLEWLADVDNPAALAFYEARGARQSRGKVVYRVEVPR
ncbi:GNAT family N-acetyltransferase [Streptomyces sp. NPDC091280]|uniref:GNAT family N-acetyltransferase n=1 Tax=Streptomyces sp. NPDC091280 TaxID=3365984 RepID=UPI0037FCFA69